MKHQPVSRCEWWPFELNKENTEAFLLPHFEPTSITQALVVKTVITRQSQESSNGKGHIDLPYCKDGNLIISQALNAREQDIFLPTACRTRRKAAMLFCSCCFITRLLKWHIHLNSNHREGERPCGHIHHKRMCEVKRNGPITCWEKNGGWVGNIVVWVSSMSDKAALKEEQSDKINVSLSNITLWKLHLKKMGKGKGERYRKHIYNQL